MAADDVKTYAAMTGLDEAEILAWLPAVAAARLAEGIEPEKASLLWLAGLAVPEE